MFLVRENFWNFYEHSWTIAKFSHPIISEADITLIDHFIFERKKTSFWQKKFLTKFIKNSKKITTWQWSINHVTEIFEKSTVIRQRLTHFVCAQNVKNVSIFGLPIFDCIFPIFWSKIDIFQPRTFSNF